LAHYNFFYTSRGVKSRLLVRYPILLPLDRLTVIFFTQVRAITCRLLVRYSISLPFGRVMVSVIFLNKWGVQHQLLVSHPILLCPAWLTEHKSVGKCRLSHCHYSFPIGSPNTTRAVKCQLSHCNFYYTSRGAHITFHHCCLPNLVTTPIIPPPPSSCPLMISRLLPLLLDRFPSFFLLIVLYSGLLCRLQSQLCGSLPWSTAVCYAHNCGDEQHQYLFIGHPLSKIETVYEH